MYKDFIKNNISNLSEELIKEYAKDTKIKQNIAETISLFAGHKSVITSA